VLFAFALFAPQAQAQEEINEGYNKGVSLMQEKKWAEALTVLNQLVKDWGDGAPETIGPAFGLIYYHVAFCELMLKNYKSAATNFQTTYEKFPNSILKPEQSGSNIYHLKSLYMWGLSLQRDKDYAGALKRYERFLQKDPEVGEDYKPYELAIDMAYCHIEIAGGTEDAAKKRRSLKEGSELLQKVYDKFERLRLKEKHQLYITFLALAEKWVAGSMVSEGMAFMDKNDGPLRWSPYEMDKYKFNQRLLKLGQEASGGGEGEGKNKDLESLALRFFSFIPRLEAAVADLEERLRGGFRTEAQAKEYTDEIARIKGDIANGKNPDVTALLLTANIHEGKGNMRAAYAVYDYIVHQYDQAKIQIDKKVISYLPDALFHATRTSFGTGDLMTAQYHGLDFLKRFPGHKHEPAVQSMLLEYLFRAGEFVRCIEIATPMKDKLAKGSKQHDLCIFVLGGSYYFEGQYKEAEPELDAHVTAYPTSDYIAESSYYQASNQVKLLAWGKASGLLDEWLKKYKENPLRPLALLDRAICHYAIDELDETIVMVTEIETKYPNHDILDRGLNLRGDVYVAKNMHKEAYDSYIAAKKLATSQGDSATVAESLTQLIATCATLADAIDDDDKAKVVYTEATGYYDDFIQGHGGHYLEPQAVANALPPLIKVGRGQDGLTKMEQMIVRLSDEKSLDLEKAVTTYAANYIVNYEKSPKGGPETLLARLKEWPKEAGNLDLAVRAWLMITGIDVMEEKKYFKEPPARVEVLFNELMGMDLTELAPYVLARIITNLQAKGQAGRALKFADEIISRDGTDQKDIAYFVKAEHLRNSANKSDRDEAITYYTKIVKELESDPFKDDSVHALGMLYMANGEWKNAEEWFNIYVADKRINSHNPEVWYELGKAREKQNNIIGGSSKKTAAIAYERCWGQYAGHFKYSCPAFNKSLEIEEKHGSKQKAYNLASSWLRSMAKYTNHEIAGKFLRETTEIRDRLADDPSVTVPEEK